MGKRITTRAPSTRKPRKPRPQVRRNKDAGKIFEAAMFQYFTEYLKKRDIKGVVYRIPESNYDQPVDMLIDSPDWLYVAAECKSIKNSSDSNGKLYFSKMSSVSKKNGKHQFVNQHEFISSSGRYGVVCFNFRDMQKIIIVPHNYVYSKYINGDLYITTEEIILNGFDISDEKASLKLYIRNKCKTGD